MDRKRNHVMKKPGRMYPGVGVCVVVFDDVGRFLMLHRTGSHGAGTWTVPGGWLEWGETPEEAAHREVAEEVGIGLGRPHFTAVTNDVFDDEGVHSVTLWLVASHDSGDPQIQEPDKCTALDWFTIDTMPEPLFLPVQQVSRVVFDHTLIYDWRRVE